MTIIRDVTNNREENLDFSQIVDCNYIDISFGDLLSRCHSSIVLDDSVCYLVVYDGMIIHAGQSLVLSSSGCPKVVYLFQASQRFGTINEFRIDPLSLQSAKKWIHESELFPSLGMTAQLAISLQSNPSTSIAAPQVQNPPLRENPPDLRGRFQIFIDFIQLGLLVRLGLLFAILQYNRNAADIRTYYIAGALLVVYLFQSGLLSRFLALCYGWLIPNGNIQDRVPSIFQRLVAVGQKLVQDGVNIPTQEGFLFDLAALIISLVGSFFPGWLPRSENNRR